MPKEIIDLARQRSIKLGKIIEKLKNKLLPYEKELERVSKVIHLFDPTVSISQSTTYAKEARVEEVHAEEPEEMNTSDMVRYVLSKRPDGATNEQLKHDLGIIFPIFTKRSPQQYYQSMIYLTNQGEVNKFGIGMLAIHKPTPKLKAIQL